MNFFKKFSRLDAFVFTILGDLPDVFKIPTTSVSIFAGKNGINMIPICFILVFSFCILTAGGQQMSHDLSYYAEAARNYSPLLHDYRHQLQIEQAELRRLIHPFTAGAERGLPVRTRPDQRRGTNFFPMERTGCHGLLRLRLGREQRAPAAGGASGADAEDIPVNYGT